MKKLLSLTGMAALVLAFALTGCGSNNNNSAESDVNETDTNETQAENAQSERDYYKVTELPQLDGVKSGDTIATLHTSMGDIKVWFFPEYAPKAVENFTTHAKEGYYDNLIFHRVINDFMIQGGDPQGTGAGGESIWGADFENECSANLRSFRGALCMANAGADTNGSQFYIVQCKDASSFISQIKAAGDQSVNGSDVTFSDVYPENVVKAYAENGGYPSLDFGYTIFGQVYEGMDIVDSIAAVQTDNSDKPLTDVKIESIEVGVY